MDLAVYSDIADEAVWRDLLSYMIKDRISWGIHTLPMETFTTQCRSPLGKERYGKVGISKECREKTRIETLAAVRIATLAAQHLKRGTPAIIALP